MVKRGNFRVIAVVTLLGVLILFVCFHFRMSPLMKDLAEANVSNKASLIINEAIGQQLDCGEIDYDRIIFLEKNVNGNITAIKTNVSEINRIKNQVLNYVDDLLLDVDISEIGIPMGNLFFPKLFSGRGPLLPVRIMMVSASDADFRNVFHEAGINQTVHQIMLDVRIVMSVVTPAGRQSVSVVSSVVLAETVIVGSVPNSYVDLNR